MLLVGLLGVWLLLVLLTRGRRVDLLLLLHLLLGVRWVPVLWMLIFRKCGVIHVVPWGGGQWEHPWAGRHANLQGVCIEGMLPLFPSLYFQRVRTNLKFLRSDMVPKWEGGRAGVHLCFLEWKFPTLGKLAD